MQWLLRCQRQQYLVLLKSSFYDQLEKDKGYIQETYIISNMELKIREFPVLVISDVTSLASNQGHGLKFEARQFPNQPANAVLAV